MVFFNVSMNFPSVRSRRRLLFALGIIGSKFILLFYAHNPAVAKPLADKEFRFQGFIPHQCDKNITARISQSSLSDDWKLYQEPIPSKRSVEKPSNKFIRVNHQLNLMTISCMNF